MTSGRLLRIGFLGAGHIATFHSKSIRRALHSLDFEVERAGVFDPDTERRDAFARASGHVPMNSADEVIRSCDAVYVCTWTSEHLRLVEAIAAAGKAVFCEKPLATNYVDSQRMVDVLRSAGVTNQVGLILRHSPAFLKIRELIADESSGRVMSVVVRDDQFIPVQGHYASTWRRDVDKAGAGTLLEHSIHDVDMLHALVGPIRSVSARFSNFHGHSGIEDAVAASITFEATHVGDPSPIGTLTSVWHDNLARPSQRRVEVFCENRFISLDGDDWFGPVTWSDSDGSIESMDGERLVQATSHLTVGAANPDAAFLRAAFERRSAFPDASVALRAHRVVQAMYESAGSDGERRSVETKGPDISIRRVSAIDVRPLRLDVLRRGMVSRIVDFDGDDEPTTVHLAAITPTGEVVGVSTWLAREHVGDPGRAALQLRGMATARHLQGTGIGASLLRAGKELARERGAALVWANARDAALAFYNRHGFATVGDGFIESVTSLPHHRVIHRLH